MKSNARSPEDVAAGREQAARRRGTPQLRVLVSRGAASGVSGGMDVAAALMGSPTGLQAKTRVATGERPWDGDKAVGEAASAPASSWAPLAAAVGSPLRYPQ